FNIATSVNPYLAMKATLIEARKHPKIESVAIPGFCTGVGRMQPEIAARQMYQAFKEIEKEEKMNFADFAEAQKYHWRINPQGMIFDY
ncbi:MAG: Appr-1-p processing protein, partial [Chitinophagales bacterium]